MKFRLRWGIGLLDQSQKAENAPLKKQNKTKHSPVPSLFPGREAGRGQADQETLLSPDCIASPFSHLMGQREQEKDRDREWGWGRAHLTSEV